MRPVWHFHRRKWSRASDYLLCAFSEFINLYTAAHLQVQAVVDT